VSVALVIHHAKHMWHIMSSVVSLALPYFSTLSHKWHNFWNKVTENKICVFIFSTSFVWNISHSKKNSVTYYYKSTQVFIEITHYLCQILIKIQFSWHFKKISITLHENVSSGNQVFPYGWMNKHDEAKSLFTIFLMCLEITPFRASASRKITQQPILVKVQGTIYQKCPVLTGNYTPFLTNTFSSVVW